MKVLEKKQVSGSWVVNYFSQECQEWPFMLKMSKKISLASKIKSGDKISPQWPFSSFSGYFNHVTWSSSEDGVLSCHGDGCFDMWAQLLLWFPP